MDLSKKNIGLSVATFSLFQIRRRNFISNFITLFCFRMEETVRSMLQYKACSEQLKQEKTNLTIAYEVSQHTYMEDYLPPFPTGFSKFRPEDSVPENNMDDISQLELIFFQFRSHAIYY
jgi:hypothetical protein